MVDAIERVLKTERDGVEALRRANEQAQNLLAQGRAQASALAKRADQCIARLHGAYRYRINQQIYALMCERPDGNAAGSAYDDATIDQAVRRVAARLTGGS